MPAGFPDWRPPGLGAGGRLVVSAAATSDMDLIASPGANNRIVLFDGLAVPLTNAADLRLDERTPANVTVRYLLQVFGNVGAGFNMAWSGVPLAPGNKVYLVRSLNALWYVTVTYAIEPV